MSILKSSKIFPYSSLIACCLTISCVSILLANEFEPISKTTLPAMEMVTYKIQENFDSIRTWQGVVHYNRRGADGEWVDNMIVEYYIDRIHDRRLVIAKHIKTEIKGQPQPLDIIGILLVGDLYYEFRGINPDGLIPIPQQGTDAGKFVLLKDIEENEYKASFLRGRLRISPRSGFAFSDSNLKDNFDPFYVITHRPKSASVSYMHDLITVVKSDVTYKSEILIKSVENLVEISWQQPSDNSPCKYLYDLKQGGNCIIEEIPDNRSIEPALRKVEYVNINGIFVPKNVDYNLRGKIIETMEFISQTINEPINENIFTTVTLGVKRGDACYDERTQVSSTINDLSFPEREQVLFAPKRTSKSISYVFVGIGTLIFFSGLFLKFWKQKKSLLESLS